MIRVLFADDDPRVLDSLRQLQPAGARGGVRARSRWPSSSASRPTSSCPTSACLAAPASCPGARPLPKHGAHRALQRGPSRDGAAGDPPGASYLGKPCRRSAGGRRQPHGLYTHLDDHSLRGIVAGLTRLPSVPHIYPRSPGSRRAPMPPSTRSRPPSTATPRWWRKCCRWGTRRGLAASAASRQSARRCSFSAPTCCAAWRWADRRSGPRGSRRSRAFRWKRCSATHCTPPAWPHGFSKGRRGWTTRSPPRWFSIGQVVLATGRRADTRKCAAAPRPNADRSTSRVRRIRRHPRRHRRLPARHVGPAVPHRRGHCLPPQPAARRSRRTPHPRGNASGGRADEHGRARSRRPHSRAAARHRLPRFVRHPSLPRWGLAREESQAAQ